MGRAYAAARAQADYMVGRANAMAYTARRSQSALRSYHSTREGEEVGQIDAIFRASRPQWVGVYVPTNPALTREALERVVLETPRLLLRSLLAFDGCHPVTIADVPARLRRLWAAVHPETTLIHGRCVRLALCPLALHAHRIRASRVCAAVAEALDLPVDLDDAGLVLWVHAEGGSMAACMELLASAPALLVRGLQGVSHMSLAEHCGRPAVFARAKSYAQVLDMWFVDSGVGSYCDDPGQMDAVWGIDVARFAIRNECERRGAPLMGNALLQSMVFRGEISGATRYSSAMKEQGFLATMTHEEPVRLAHDAAHVGAKDPCDSVAARQVFNLGPRQQFSLLNDPVASASRLRAMRRAKRLSVVVADALDGALDAMEVDGGGGDDGVAFEMVTRPLARGPLTPTASPRHAPRAPTRSTAVVETDWLN